MAHCRRPRSLDSSWTPPLRNFTSTRSTYLFSLERERKRNLERDRTIVERERIFFLFHFTNGRTTTTMTTTTIPFDIEFSSGETKKRGWVSVKRDRREGKHPSIVRAKILRDKWRARSMHASSSPSKKVWKSIQSLGENIRHLKWMDLGGYKSEGWKKPVAVRGRPSGGREVGGWGWRRLLWKSVASVEVEVETEMVAVAAVMVVVAGGVGDLRETF